MKISKQIKVLDNYFEVELRDVVLFEGVENYGLCEFGSKHKIILQKKQPNTKNSLLHEIVHAIEKTQRLGLTENQVDLLSTMLRTVIIDNPKLIEIFKED